MALERRRKLLEGMETEEERSEVFQTPPCAGHMAVDHDLFRVVVPRGLNPAFEQEYVHEKLAARPKAHTRGVVETTSGYVIPIPSWMSAGNATAYALRKLDEMHALTYHQPDPSALEWGEVYDTSKGWRVVIPADMSHEEAYALVTRALEERRASHLMREALSGAVAGRVHAHHSHGHAGPAEGHIVADRPGIAPAPSFGHAAAPHALYGARHLVPAPRRLVSAPSSNPRPQGLREGREEKRQTEALEEFAHKMAHMHLGGRE
eukprot:tig00001576_g9361.t1